MIKFVSIGMVDGDKVWLMIGGPIELDRYVFILTYLI